MLRRGSLVLLGLSLALSLHQENAHAFAFRQHACFPTRSAAAMAKASPCPRVIQRNAINEKMGDSVTETPSVLRRQFFASVPALLLLGSAPPAARAVMENNQKVFQAGQALGVPVSKERFQEARKSLKYLLDNYDTIVKQGGGDNVRRYLGTVGTTSALYGIPKVLKELQDESSDIVEYTENMSEFDYYLRAADTAAYSALFVEHSSAKGTPQQYLADARKAAEKMTVYMDRMAAELDM